MTKLESGLLIKVNTWLTSPIDQDKLDRYLKLVRQLTDILGFEGSDLIIPVLIYSERFIQKNGLTQPEKLPIFFALATCIAIKFWEEEGKKCCKLKYVAILIGFSSKDFARLERELLTGLKFDLFITEDEYKDFKDILT